jgi:hypothetical protein
MATLSERIDKNGPVPAARPDLGHCWTWTGPRSRYGYGRHGAKHAHRLVYEAARGPIPVGLVCDHLCRNRGCVNPEHIEPVTSGENVRRGISGQLARERQRAKTHCPRGHAYEGANLRVYGGRRHCRACQQQLGPGHEQARKQRTKRLPTRLTRTEFAALEAMAARLGITVTAAVRRAIALLEASCGSS